MIAIDSCKANYQTLLITYMELTIKNANHASKEKKNQISMQFYWVLK